MAAAVEDLKRHRVDVLGEPTTMVDGASAGLTWVSFRAPWGLQLELVSARRGLTYEQSGGRPMWRSGGDHQSRTLNT